MNHESSDVLHEQTATRNRNMHVGVGVVLGMIATLSVQQIRDRLTEPMHPPSPSKPAVIKEDDNTNALLVEKPMDTSTTSTYSSRDEIFIIPSFDGEYNIESFIPDPAETSTPQQTLNELHKIRTDLKTLAAGGEVGLSPRFLIRRYHTYLERAKLLGMDVDIFKDTADLHRSVVTQEMLRSVTSLRQATQEGTETRLLIVQLRNAERNCFSAREAGVDTKETEAEIATLRPGILHDAVQYEKAVLEEKVRNHRTPEQHAHFTDALYLHSLIQAATEAGVDFSGKLPQEQIKNLLQETFVQSIETLVHNVMEHNNWWDIDEIKSALHSVTELGIDIPTELKEKADSIVWEEILRKNPNPRGPTTRPLHTHQILP